MTWVARTVRGLIGWVSRSVFVAGFAAGAVGVYIALFASLGQRGPGHDRIVGLEFVAAGFAASRVGRFLAFHPGPPERPRWREIPADREEWYWHPYWIFLVTGVLALLLGSGLRFIGDWERSNVAVTSTLSDCALDVVTDSNNSTDLKVSSASESCTYGWDWKGVHHQITLGDEEADSILVWIDPVDGAYDAHSYKPIVLSFVLAGIVGCGDLIACIIVGRRLYERRSAFPGWAADLAWWRTPVDPAAAPTVPGEPVIEDARPGADAGTAPYEIEDARPSG